MRATGWEFKNRAMVFGWILGFSFPLYGIDHVNAGVALGDWLAPRLGLDPDIATRLVFALGALLVIKAAFMRTWASSFLHASVVYAGDVKSASLVADGPYRRVRNPLYLANVLMVIGMGFLMSRLGFGVALVAMVVFCYRLILREETELEASQGESYRRYRGAVPRLWPSPWPRIPSSGRPANWREGVKAELWYWGFAAAAVAFAITLSIALFLIILAASVAVFWFSSRT